MLVLLFYLDYTNQSEAQVLGTTAAGAALTNQKLSCWVPLGTVTGFHTKPPIMLYFSAFHSVLINVLSPQPHFQAFRGSDVPLLGVPLCRLLLPRPPPQAPDSIKKIA